MRFQDAGDGTQLGDLQIIAIPSAPGIRIPSIVISGVNAVACARSGIAIERTVRDIAISNPLYRAIRQCLDPGLGSTRYCAATGSGTLSTSTATPA